MITQDDHLIFETYQNKLILEKTIKYFVPKDKEKLLFDFYMMMNLNGVIQGTEAGRKVVDGVEQETDTARTGRLNENIEDSFENAKEKLLEYLKPHLLDAVFFAICAEIRHIYDEVHGTDIKRGNDGEPISLSGFDEYVEKMLGDDLKELYKEYEDAYQKRTYTNDEDNPTITRDSEHRMERKNTNRISYMHSYKSALYAIKKTGKSRSQFVKLALKFYNDLRWSGAYGGVNWGNICKGWLLLAKADSGDELEVMTAIDHVYHLQHNTSTVFNKLTQYYKIGQGYSWVLRALNKRENIDSPYVLYENITTPMRRMSGYILKAGGYSGWDEYIKNKEKPKPEPEQPKPQVQQQHSYIPSINEGNITNVAIKINSNQEGNETIQKILDLGLFEWRRDIDPNMYGGTHYIHYPYIVFIKRGDKYDLDIINYSKASGKNIVTPKVFFNNLHIKNPIIKELTSVSAKINSNEEANSLIKEVESIIKSPSLDLFSSHGYGNVEYDGNDYKEFPYFILDSVGNKVYMNAFPTNQGTKVYTPEEYINRIKEIINKK